MTGDVTGDVTDHERIDELLAGYVLRSLTGDDAREADRLLSEHVPVCRTCRATLGDFQGMMGELALDAAPLTPPETLLPRIHREMGPSIRRRRPLTTVAAAASVVAVVGLAGLAVSQGVRASNETKRRALMGEAWQLASRPDATQVALTGTGTPDSPDSPVTEISAPGVEVVYLVCRDLPAPAPGMVYRVWLGSGTGVQRVLDFVPDTGVTVLRLQFDPTSFDRVMITEEPAGSVPDAPAAASIRWSAAA